jgi:hypothetical protein
LIYVRRAADLNRRVTANTRLMTLLSQIFLSEISLDGAGRK